MSGIPIDDAPQTHDSTRPAISRSRFARVVAASMAGTVAEWYEFFLYGLSAALVFGHVFFKATGNPLDGVIAALLTYAVGFIARPFGGLLFGYLGDKLGRKKLLQVSLLVIGTSTFLIGTIPSFDQIGYAAPAILVVLRFAQGLALGGEWGGAILLVAEQSPDDKRGFWSSFPQIGAPLGNFLATIVLLVLSWSMPEESFLSWGWRIAFFLSAVIVILGWFIRKRVDDAPIFKNAAETRPPAENMGAAVKRVFKARPREVLTAMGSRLIENVLYYIIVTFSLTYLQLTQGMNLKTILTIMLGAHILHGVMLLVFGWMSDKVGRRPVYMVGAVLATGYAFVAFPLMGSSNTFFVFCAIAIGMIIHATMYAIQPSMLSEMFPTHMRYIGVSIGNQVTTIIGGSLAPVIATWLLRKYDSWIPIGIYMAAVGVVSIVSIFFMRETAGKSLASIDDEHSKKFGMKL